MLSWRSWSSSMRPYDTAGGEADQLRPDHARRGRRRDLPDRRNDRLPRRPRRDVAAVLLPRGRDDVAHRPRHRAAERRLAGALDRARVRRAHYLCLRRGDARRGDRARRRLGSVGRSEEETGDREAGVPYVVVDFSADALELAQERGDLLIDGNGTEDEDLRAAGLERARGLVASSDSDSDNLYITLSAR